MTIYYLDSLKTDKDPNGNVTRYGDNKTFGSLSITNALNQRVAYFDNFDNFDNFDKHDKHDNPKRMIDINGSGVMV